MFVMARLLSSAGFTVQTASRRLCKIPAIALDHAPNKIISYTKIPLEANFIADNSHRGLQA
jgi:hypothetical protein